jgi:hypothetical protein
MGKAAAGRGMRGSSSASNNTSNQLRDRPLGVIFVNERLSWNLAVGTGVVLLGVWIAERNPADHGVPTSETPVSSEDGEAGMRQPIR